MRLNDFALTIPEGREVDGGYVQLQHGTQYTVRLHNYWERRCEAQVKVDGKDIGTFRLEANGELRLERKPDDRGRFTFYRSGSVEAEQADLERVSRDELGLISVTFTAGKPFSTVALASPMSGLDGPTYRTLNAPSAAPRSGGTGLSGYSRQDFTTVSALNLDQSTKTTIHLRLVEGDTVRPLTSVENKKETPVPKPVD